MLPGDHGKIQIHFPVDVAPFEPGEIRQGNAVVRIDNDAERLLTVEDESKVARGTERERSGREVNTRLTEDLLDSLEVKRMVKRIHERGNQQRIHLLLPNS